MKKILENRLLIIKIVIFFMMFFSSMIVVQYHGYTLFFIMQLIFCVVMFLITKSVVLIDSFFINSIYGMLFVTTIVAYLSNISATSKNNAIYFMIISIPMYFVISYLNSCVLRKREIIDLIKKALQLMCMTQLVWCLLQFLLYRIAGIDLNELIFVKTFHCVEVASLYRLNKFVPSGISWHPAILAPIFVLSYCMFDNIGIKILILIDSVICDNSTALIGVITCFAFDIIRKCIKFLREKEISRKAVFAIIAVVIVFCILVIKSDIVGFALDKMIYTYQRIAGIVDDGGSSLAHKRYFTAYPQVVKISSIPQILFGYGENCSGYPFQILFNQYVDVASWAVESDVMNILYSRGIIGFILYYTFLFFVGIKGSRINYKYLLFIVAVALEGITYNVQYEWVFLLEMILLISVINQYDFFDK